MRFRWHTGQADQGRVGPAPPVGGVPDGKRQQQTQNDGDQREPHVLAEQAEDLCPVVRQVAGQALPEVAHPVLAA